MKDNNNYLDSRLRELIDFVPESKPDWEAFYRLKQQEFEILKKTKGGNSIKRFFTSSGFRNTWITLTVVTIFITGYYLTNNSKTGNDDPVITPEIPVVNQNEIIIPSGSSVSGQKSTDPAKDLIKATPEIPVNLIIEDKSSAPVTVEKPGPHVNKVTSGSEKQGTISLPADTLGDNPVLIKKTVIIQDTIRIKRTFQK